MKRLVTIAALSFLITFSLGLVISTIARAEYNYNLDSPMVDQYSSPLQEVEVKLYNEDHGSTLPFTGVEMTYLFFGGLLLVGSGFALRKASRPAGRDNK